MPDLVIRDKKYLWHPLTQHKTAAPPLAIVKAKGARIWDDRGKSYIDGIASWYSAMYGHGNEHIIAAMHQQMQQLDFVMFSGFTHGPAVELSEKLLAILPDNQRRIFFNDNGSTAVEAAIKMALQFFFNKGEKRDTLIAFENGFHGDTFGAMSASGLSSYNGPFEDFLLKVVRIPTPKADNSEALLREVEGICKEHAVAAFVFEPLVQGAAGMKFHSAQGLDALLECLHKHDVLCIADEIMTGFGKTGRNFASDHLVQKPDIICLSKALTAGMFPLSITSATEEVFAAFLSDNVAKGFFHAHTYSAHPIGCAAAIAAMDLLASESITQNIGCIGRSHQGFKSKIEQHQKVREVRTMGVILALDLEVTTDRYGSLRDRLYQLFLDRGVVLRPLGNTIYVLPPYIITEQDLALVYKAIEEVLEIV
ncbi:adenosylmethionine--8-amino-7-oxononanoate transaminase [Muricauda sp. SCSIO 64092]|uniref:adenosylmethionine--8-amino-7-oxononanoate transaminase n=1 Tax=Allomuricauda sp. SCSIO 64092 TaxID=2908842 RepID=UPI001FF29219|nr:adenosylmethionine--8-amino-7-oxononanoate transaminase [Muricauda sp. SCSIO 64092]UOY04703.1 adenosylmethionine--8-amino-7-oxononanoate transaminase [Muricauda sp. SCSIO 64092]